MMIDPREFWSLMGSRPVSVPVVAAKGAEGPSGLLALSATHLSASPPTMLVCVGHTTSALKTIHHARSFAISYLPVGAEKVADIFGGRGGVAGSDRFVPDDWTTLETGAPVFSRAVAAFDCKVAATFTHTGTDIIVGEIVAYKVDQSAVPLISYRGAYRAVNLQ
ncbi:flavin reductase family protein [Mesorhizobium sp.]|uniref:flavin reductase family protein n=1 Tax=Mesorhizobium sp. TaxID=1871066 RepID=UPI000FE9D789|nr:flavin reductase family protein [Mesorhizobium sp.]RWJ05684.1 MAG: flavin reductase [Mesorhizobium sp.]